MNTALAKLLALAVVGAVFSSSAENLVTFKVYNNSGVDQHAQIEYFGPSGQTTFYYESSLPSFQYFNLTQDFGDDDPSTYNWVFFNSTDRGDPNSFPNGIYNIFCWIDTNGVFNSSFTDDANYFGATPPAPPPFPPPPDTPTTVLSAIVGTLTSNAAIILTITMACLSFFLLTKWTKTGLK